jgi:hypothetical protein
MKFIFLLDQKDGFGLFDSEERDLCLIVFKLSPPPHAWGGEGIGYNFKSELKFYDIASKKKAK